MIVKIYFSIKTKKRKIIASHHLKSMNISTPIIKIEIRNKSRFTVEEDQKLVSIVFSFGVKD
jgi:hypothetical protein